MTPDELAAVELVDAWLDADAQARYQEQPLAQDWARVAKITEEAGEAVDALIGLTGQNPRKGSYGTREKFLSELADTAWTAVFALQHFTKSKQETGYVLQAGLAKAVSRVPEVTPEFRRQLAESMDRNDELLRRLAGS